VSDYHFDQAASNFLEQRQFFFSEISFFSEIQIGYVLPVFISHFKFDRAPVDLNIIFP